MLDDGRLPSTKGRVLNFKNTIIIMTSNIGLHIIQENFENLERKDVDAVVEMTQREVMELLRKTVRPEFLNRVDELIMFRPPIQPFSCPLLPWLLVRRSYHLPRSVRVSPT